jgi:hypothetical protein
MKATRLYAQAIMAAVLAGLLFMFLWVLPGWASAPVESSYLWTTGGVGDAITYTTADWSNIIKVVSASPGGEGVGTWLDNLAATATTNKVTISTGAAVVDGKPYLCSVAGDITIPSAVGGGNTRIDRIVLRANWISQTVRLYRIPGTDAASPSAPVYSSTRGSSFDVLLWQATVNASGAVTLVDERQWGTSQLKSYSNGIFVTSLGLLGVHVDGTTIITSGNLVSINSGGVGTAQLATAAVSTTNIGNVAVTADKLAASVAGDGLTGGVGTPLAVNVDNATLATSADQVIIKAGGVGTAQLATNAVTTTNIGNVAVTTAKLANSTVDDTKVGNRVPKLKWRQGGDATDWSVAGTTTYTPTGVLIETGVVTVPIASGTYNSITVTLPSAFSAKPAVLLSLNSHNFGGGNLDYYEAPETTISTTSFVLWVFVVNAVTNKYATITWEAKGPE